MSAKIPAHELSEILDAYRAFIDRTSLTPNLLLVGPDTEVATMGHTSVIAMRVVVNDGARVDFEVGFLSS